MPVRLHLFNASGSDVARSTSLVIARLLWIFPAMLLLLTLYQVDAAMDLRETLAHGQPAVAQVTAFETTDRVDVTYDYIGLRVELADGRVIERPQLSLPHSFVPVLRGKTELPVRVLPGADQEIVIEEIARPLWRMAAINAAMSLVGFLLLAIGVFAWNRYLVRRGDPARRSTSSMPEAG